MLFNTSLFFHIIAITLMAGATIVDFVLTRRFWVFYAKDPQQGILARKMTGRMTTLIIPGLFLLLLSGVGMMAATNGVFDTMLWFRVKMVLVLLIILNAILNGRRLMERLNRLLAPGIENQVDVESLSRVRRNLNVFHITQLALFLTIFFLSAFKFN